jgi:hypothetical protein
MTPQLLVGLLDLPNELLAIIAELLYGTTKQLRRSCVSSLQQFSRVNRRLRAIIFPILVRALKFDSWEEFAKLIYPNFSSCGKWGHLASYVRLVIFSYLTSTTCSLLYWHSQIIMHPV